MALDPQSESHDKGHWGLRDSGIMALSPRLSPCLGPASLNLVSTWPLWGLGLGPKRVPEVPSRSCILVLAPPGSIGWKSQAST